MRAFQWAGPLSLCLVLLLGLSLPVAAEEGEVPAMRVYYDPNPEPFETWIWPGDTVDWVAARRLLVQRGNDGEQQFFGTSWDLEAFSAAVDAGESDFAIGGRYNDSYLGPENQELWDQGLIQIEEGSQPTLMVHVRPEGLESQLCPWWEPDPLYVTPTTAFANAGFPEALEMGAVEGSEGGSYDYAAPKFRVIWDEEAYKAGLEAMAAGATSFQVSGEYAGPEKPEDPEDLEAQLGYERYLALWDENLVVFPNELKITVNQLEVPEEPRLYESWRGDSPYYAVAAAGASPAELGDAIPTAETLYAVDSGDELSFQLVWNEEEYLAGMESGQDSFEITGVYALADQTLQSWLEAGLIQPEAAPANLVVQVVGPDSKLLREDTVKLRQYDGNKVAPAFFLPAMNQATRVACAYSSDGETWYETVLDSGYFKGFGEADWYNVGVYDSHNNVCGVDPDAPVYCKVTVVGSAWAGEWRHTMNEAGDEPPTVNDGDDDDQGGDRGGGGQGVHDRPGKQEELDLEEVQSILEQIGEAIAALGRESEPEPVRPPEPPALEPETEDRPEPPPSVPSASADSQKTQPAILQSPDTAAKPIPPVPQPGEQRERQAASENLAPAPEPGPQLREFPGFAVAAAATALLILGGAVWYGRRRKKA